MPVGCGSAPDVLAEVDGHTASEGVVEARRRLSEEGIEFHLVEMGQDVRDTVVHPGEVWIPVVLAWGPSGGVRYQTCPNADEP